jgi:hypothetical protein
MDDEENARIQERDNLKVALATFALRLDAFEMRMSGARLAAGQSGYCVSLIRSAQRGNMVGAH